MEFSNKENEIWKDIPGYEGRYQISNFGNVKKIIIPNKKEVPLNGCIDRNGYKKVALSKKTNGILTQKTHLVHRIVGYVFVPGYKQGLEINHKDGNKSNNYYKNLEWVTRSENMIHAVANGLTTYATGPRVYTFCQFDKKGNLIRKWGSINDCAYFLSSQGYGEEKIIKGNIMACLNERIKSCCGFLFSFKDTIDAESKLPETCIAVVATRVIGLRGHRTLSKDPKDTIRFRYINETEGYIMPNGEKACATNVSKCCKGLRDSHAGYAWRYEKNNEFTFNAKRQSEKIYQYDLNWSLIRVFSGGVMEIVKELGFASNSGISTCLNSDDENKTAYGYHWRYEPK